MERNIYQGWVVVEEAAEGYRPQVLVEWNEGSERKKEYMKSRGRSGCAEAIEWWDRKLGCTVLLEATVRGCYRVYTKG